MRQVDDDDEEKGWAMGPPSQVCLLNTKDGTWKCIGFILYTI